MMTETNGTSETTWKDAAAASEEAHRPDDVLWRRMVRRVLFMPLAPAQMADQARIAAAAFIKRDAILAELKSITKTLKAKASVADSEGKAAMQAITDMGMEREVECPEVALLSTNSVTVRRPDNGAVFEERALRAEERQQKLPLPEPQLSLDEVAESIGATAGDDSFLVDGDGVITDPESVLAGDIGDSDAEPDAPKPRRRRAGK